MKSPALPFTSIKFIYIRIYALHQNSIKSLDIFTIKSRNWSPRNTNWLQLSRKLHSSLRFFFFFLAAIGSLIPECVCGVCAFELHISFSSKERNGNSSFNAIYSNCKNTTKRHFIFELMVSFVWMLASLLAAARLCWTNAACFYCFINLVHLALPCYIATIFTSKYDTFFTLAASWRKVHFYYLFYLCYRSICTPVNNDYVHLTWNRTVVRRAINGRRCNAVQRIRQCQSLWESETKVPPNHLDCHFPVRILIVERKRAMSKKKKPSRCFSFYHFII